jgi:hypothetical protein
MDSSSSLSPFYIYIFMTHMASLPPFCLATLDIESNLTGRVMDPSSSLGPKSNSNLNLSPSFVFWVPRATLLPPTKLLLTQGGQGGAMDPNSSSGLKLNLNLKPLYFFNCWKYHNGGEQCTWTQAQVPFFLLMLHHSPLLNYIYYQK